MVNKLILLLSICCLAFSCSKPKGEVFVLVETVKLSHLERLSKSQGCDEDADNSRCKAILSEIKQVEDLALSARQRMSEMCLSGPPCDRGKSPTQLSEVRLGFTAGEQTKRIRFTRDSALVAVCGQPKDTLIRGEKFRICTMRPAGNSGATGIGEITIVIDEVFPGKPPRTYQSLLTHTYISL